MPPPRYRYPDYPDYMTLLVGCPGNLLIDITDGSDHLSNLVEFLAGYLGFLYGLSRIGTALVHCRHRDMCALRSSGVILGRNELFRT